MQQARAYVENKKRPDEYPTVFALFLCGYD
jgi:hypothetical protein